MSNLDLDELERWSRDKKAEGDDHVCLTFDVYDALIAAARALSRAQKEQSEAVATFRREGIVFATNIAKPWAELTEAERWEAIAFDLYNRLVAIEIDARNTLQEFDAATLAGEGAPR